MEGQPRLHGRYESLDYMVDMKQDLAAELRPCVNTSKKIK